MDIITLPVEFDNKKIDSKFRIVLMAAQRAKELSLGTKPKIETKSKKVTTVAIEEAITDSLEFLTGEEAARAKEEASKFDYRKLIEESKKAEAGEELTELEKDLKVYLHERETTDKKAFDELFSDKKEDKSEK